jgi:hypothetical protein
MKDDKKDSQVESTTETSKDSKDVDRGTFLKTLGVGIGAVGIDVITGGRVSATTEPDSNRAPIQKLMRGLLENPAKAKDFLESPLPVAKEFGVTLTEAEAAKIRETFLKLAAEVGGGLHEGYSIWDHVDGAHHDKYSKDVKPLQKQPVSPKAPSGGMKRR